MCDPPESWYNASGDKLMFTTHERDAESGNDYAQARSYVNRLARFSSLDPLTGTAGDPQSLNRYSYVRNMPVRFIDPSGTTWVCFARKSPGAEEDAGTYRLAAYSVSLQGPGLAYVCVHFPDDFFTGDGTGGSGSDCDPETGECPPPPPPQAPPPQPQCFCDMRFRPVQRANRAYEVRRVHEGVDPGLFATHSFWFVQEASGQEWILSSGPSDPNGSGFLNSFPKSGYHIYEPPDTPGAGYLWFGSGLSTPNCFSAAAMVGTALGWPNNRIEYNFLIGPNSNSFAHFLAIQGGFSVSAPFGSFGWFYPL